MIVTLPLDSFRRHLAIHPWHFWQLTSDQTPRTAACNALTMEYAWQDADAAGRADIREAIATAEDRLHAELGYRVAPRRATATLAYRTPLVLPERHVQALGVEVETLIGTVAVTYSDSDSDGLNDHWTASSATTATDAGELFVRFRAADDAQQREIAPVVITITGGTALLSGPAWLLVKPALYERTDADLINANNAANFVQQIEVVRRTVDTTQAATLIWDAPACAPTTDVRLVLTDGDLGIVQAQAGCWPIAYGCAPDRVTVRYVAGYPLINRQMAWPWQTTVARLAAAELARPICACADANRALYHWQFDLARTSGANDEAYGAISAEDLNNPFGTRRGHIYAWRMVKRHRRDGAVLV